MTRRGIWKHYKGHSYLVLFTARQSTNGDGEGRMVVVYISLDAPHAGRINVRDEEQFHERVFKDGGHKVGDPVNLCEHIGEVEFNKKTIDRFTYVGTLGLDMSDAEAGELYEGLHETFTGREPAP